MLGGWVRTDFDVAVLFRVWSVDSDHRVANVPVAGICGAGGLLGFRGFPVWRVAGGWLPGAAGVDWIGFRFPFSGLVRGLGVSCG